MDLEIRLFEENLVSTINESQLPIEIKRLVVANILTKIESEAYRIINEQAQAKESEVEEDGN